MFVAHVTFLSPQQGGRRTPPQTGYHPQLGAGGVLTSCVIESLGDETTLAFDTVHRVRLRLLLPDRSHDAFAVGSDVCFYEGSHLVGSGTILEVH
jgi:hypothetical protein